MKRFLAVIAGFVVTSAVFVCGASVAMFLFMAEPVKELNPGEVAAVWSPNPNSSDVRVVSSSMAADRPVSRDAMQTALTEQRGASETDAGEVDMAGVASIDSLAAGNSAPGITEEPALSQAHLEWCSQKYRSYRPETNSYTPYSGGSEPCISPYMNDGVSAEAATVQYASNDTAAGFSDPHITDCMERYRSYRVSDNTYQPYGGGPRQQCR